MAKRLPVACGDVWKNFSPSFNNSFLDKTLRFLHPKNIFSRRIFSSSDFHSKNAANTHHHPIDWMQYTHTHRSPERFVVVVAAARGLIFGRNPRERH
jgi:hypothetical protein